MKKSVFSICVVTLCVLILFSLLAYFFGSSRLDEHLIGAYSPQRTIKGNRPPLPNFRRPVDYVAWTNQYLAKGKTPSSAKIYDGFWRYLGDEECMPDPSKGVEKELRKLARGPTWESGEYPEVEVYMKSVAGYVNLFEQAANKREYCLQLKPDPEVPNWGGVLPWSISGEYALCVLLAQSWQHGHDQVGRMYNACQTGLQHASHLGNSRVLLIGMGASSIREIVYRSVRHAVHHNLIDDNSYRVALDVLTGADPGSFSLTDGIYCEWATALGLLQELYPKGRLNKSLARQIEGLDIAALKRSRVNPSALVAPVDEYFVRLLHISVQPLSITLLQDVQRLRRWADHGALSNFLLTKMDRFVLNQLRALASFRATAIILQLHEYRVKHGAWPKSLSQLDFAGQPRYLIDPFYEQPFVYKPGLKSFLLYSVSEDKTDNGGRHGHWSRYYPTKKGTDFVFWPIQE